MFASAHPTRSVLAFGLAGAALLALVSCSGSSSSSHPSTSPVTTTTISRLTLEPADGCGDAFFFAVDRSATSGLTISIDAQSRSTSAPTEYEFTLPDPKIGIELARGVAVNEQMCNDVISKLRIDSTTTAVAGSVHITLGPRNGTGPIGGCPRASGTASTKGLTMADGTVIADITITATELGCYAG